MSHAIDPARARAIWLRAQRLDVAEPFGVGAEAVAAAVRHLGYVQIDTINVIERCHHHILFSRMPGYQREHLSAAQSADKSVFEYWTHALSYVPTEDFRYFISEMKRFRSADAPWFKSVAPADIRAMLKRIEQNGPLSIRDIDDDELVEKNHAWASKKPSKRVLELAFYQGQVAIAARAGMLKTYELTGKHFGWEAIPKPETDNQVLQYQLDRALRSQGMVSLDSICHLVPSRKPAMRALIDRLVKRKALVPVHVDGHAGVAHWARPEALDETLPEPGEGVHILSPFDPLIIQRKRLKLFFGYDHLFEAYVPAAKRKLGYFALPVLVGDEIVAALDLKADRANKKLLVQKWTDLGAPGAHKQAIETALERFARFQFPAAGEAVASGDT